MNVLGLSLLLGLLWIIVPQVEHWLDQQEHRWMSNMTWREPLDI